ncbi:aspartate aminotransferase family protein [Amorphus coralli]|uniref:aspartate aminotransferase family protein n=1 Tax=Amorphus coralli TaxID=340680 RepID=UPI00035CE009|nr:aspartate aminotransferase family protein [Amorphus coralli]
MATSALYKTYARADLSFESGEGAWLNGSDGRRYLDFGSGIAVTALGHAHPHMVETLTEMAGKVWHTSNVFRIPEQERFAERLCAATFSDRVFVTNSGTEAVEAAIKTARRYHFANGEPDRYRIVTFDGAFHGRTIAAIAAGGNAKYLEGFGPALEGFDQVPFGDFEAVKAVVGPQTAAVLIEPVQGEGGIRPFANEFLRKLRDLCDETGTLLVLDEVQTGVGRTGKLFAHEWSGITPDVMAIAKGIGGGFPLGACLATAEVGDAMVAGTHGSTYGGNALACAVGNAVLDVVLAPGFLDKVSEQGIVLKQKLAAVVDAHPAIFDTVRGEGLMQGLKCRVAPQDVVLATREEGLITIGAGDNVVRLLPPLVVTADEIDEAVGRLDRAATALEQASVAQAGGTA